MVGKYSTTVRIMYQPALEFTIEIDLCDLISFPLGEHLRLMDRSGQEKKILWSDDLDDD
jgi:hypothetical protein